MILTLDLQTLKAAGFSTREGFAIRKATRSLSADDQYAFINDKLDTTGDSRFAAVLSAMVLSI